MPLYHYARLLPEEIKHIKENGLIPLSQELFARKEQILNGYGVNIKINCAYLGKDETSTLRLGRIFFTPKSFKEDFGDVEDLVNNWGGEALYNHHEDDCWYQDIRDMSHPVEIQIIDPSKIVLYDEITEQIVSTPTNICFSKDIISPSLIEIRILDL